MQYTSWPLGLHLIPTFQLHAFEYHWSGSRGDQTYADCLYYLQHLHYLSTAHNVPASNSRQCTSLASARFCINDWNNFVESKAWRNMFRFYFSVAAKKPLCQTTHLSFALTRKSISGASKVLSYPQSANQKKRKKVSRMALSSNVEYYLHQK